MTGPPIVAISYNELAQRSPEWFALRAGMPTASEFSRIVLADGSPSNQLSDYAAQLAADKYAGRPLDAWSGNRFTDRGLELEEQALAAYAFLTDVDVERVGIVIRGDVGASPDGLVDEVGIVETKCLSAKEHTKLVDYVASNRRVPPGYIPQARGQLYVTDRMWNDLFFYHPDLPPVRFRITRVLRWDSALTRQVREVLERRDAFLRNLKGAQNIGTFRV